MTSSHPSDLSTRQQDRISDALKSLKEMPAEGAREVAVLLGLNARGECSEPIDNVALKAAVIATGNVTDARCTVSRTDNLSIPGATFHCQVAVLPLGYLKDIAVTLFFSLTV